MLLAPALTDARIFSGAEESFGHGEFRGTFMRKIVHSFMAAALLCLFATSPIAAQEQYSVTEIIPPPGSQYIDGLAINASGQITGVLDNHAQAAASGAPINLAFITAPNGGTVTALTYPAGARDVIGWGINDAGQVVASDIKGFIIAPNGGALTLLPGEALGINATGQVTGDMLNGTSSTNQAYLTGPNGTSPQVIGALPGTNISEGLGVNNSGQVTGVSYNLTSCGLTCGEHANVRAFYYSNGVMTDLGTLPGDLFSQGNAINASGQAAGNSAPTADGTGPTKAFVSAPNGGQLTEIGFGEARGINDAGDVVGRFGLTPTTTTASIYEHGSFFDLNSLLTGPLAPYVDLYSAFAINNSGDIVAQGSDRRRPLQGLTFLLTPRVTAAPEPATLWLLSFGLAGIGFIGRRRRSHTTMIQAG
jgi:probable HAF family extracellular repeat protein